MTSLEKWKQAVSIQDPLEAYEWWKSTGCIACEYCHEANRVWHILSLEEENVIGYNDCTVCPLSSTSEGSIQCSPHFENISKASRRISEEESKGKWEGMSEKSKIAREFMTVFRKESRLLLQEIQRIEENRTAIWHKDDPITYFKENKENYIV